MELIVPFLISFLSTLLLTPFVIWFAKSIGAIDIPNERKVHKVGIPRIGGVSIFIGFLISIFTTTGIQNLTLTYIIIGSTIIALVGFIDDILNIRPMYKFLGQVLAALVVVVFADLKIEYIILYDNFKLEFGLFSYFITVFWILALTNSINLIDGLDGLASGVTIIALSSILYLSLFQNQLMVMYMSIIVIGCCLAFLLFNFHPAKIFMGDTGSQFLGFIVSIISIIGFYKSVTIFSLFIPIIILGVPLFDTLFAILRRLLSGQSIGAADKSHIHHKLLELGFSHRETVLIIYFTCLIFGAVAISFSRVTLWQSILIFTVFIIVIQVLAELIGLMGKKKIFLSFFKKILEKK